MTRKLILLFFGLSSCLGCATDSALRTKVDSFPQSIFWRDDVTLKISKEFISLLEEFPKCLRGKGLLPEHSRPENIAGVITFLVGYENKSDKIISRQLELTNLDAGQTKVFEYCADLIIAKLNAAFEASGDNPKSSTPKFAAQNANRIFEIQFPFTFSQAQLSDELIEIRLLKIEK